ncbi:hypothetical protein ACR0ST_09135 [Aliidiomarina sp. Khilg15.8]
MLTFSRTDHWVGIYANQAHCTLVVVVTCQGKCRLLTLAQSFSLSLMVTTLQALRSSLRLAKFALVVPDHQVQRLTLQLPPDIPLAERHDTLSWLIEQQGFSPLDDWLWDAVPGDTPEQYQVLLYPREPHQTLLQELTIRPRHLRWSADSNAAQPAQGQASEILEQYVTAGPWLCSDAARLATAAALIASQSAHA